MRYFTLVFLIVSFSGFSQTISKQVIGPNGANFNNGSNKLNYTTGEILVGSMTTEDGSIQLGNGYYPSLVLSTLTTETPEIQLRVKVFPNPFTETVFITHPTEQFFEVILTDVSGKQLFKTPHQKEQPLSLDNLTSGIYFFTVTVKDSKQSYTYKIIKR